MAGLLDTFASFQSFLDDPGNAAGLQNAANALLSSAGPPRTLGQQLLSVANTGYNAFTQGQQNYQKQMMMQAQLEEQQQQQQRQRQQQEAQQASLEGLGAYTSAIGDIGGPPISNQEISEYLLNTPSDLAQKSGLSLLLAGAEGSGQSAREMEKVFAPVPGRSQDGKVTIGFPTYRGGKPGFEVPQLPKGFELLRETPEEQRIADILKARQIEKLKTEEEADRENTKSAVGEVAKIRRDINERAIISRRAIPVMKDINKMLDLVETGKFAEVKEKYGKYLPGVDPTNEQNLNSGLYRLALDEISKFKGNTTDRELKYAESITGQLGYTREALRKIFTRIEREHKRNISEQDQFRKFRGNPLDFTPDFSEDEQQRGQTPLGYVPEHRKFYK